MASNLPYLQGLPKRCLVAHRGGSLVSPENTMVAFERAVAEFRADILELDVHATADGVVVVSHDDTIDRCTDQQGRIEALSFAQISKADAGARFTTDGVTFPFRGRGLQVPRFDELLRAFPNVRMNVDVKANTPGLVDAFARCLRDAKATARVCIGSEQDDTSAALAQALPECCHFFPRGALTAFVLSAFSGEVEAPDARYHVIDMPAEAEGVRLAEAPFIELAHRFDRAVFVWTIDEEAEMRALFAAGVDGVMTDRPDVLRRVLDT